MIQLVVVLCILVLSVCILSSPKTFTMPQERIDHFTQDLRHALCTAPPQADCTPFQSNESSPSSEESVYMSSLRSSILDYRYENGRRYHAYREGVYPFPNDHEEQDRMDLGHHIYRLLLGGELYLAPIGDDPKRVLDLGTGTGIWAINFADEFPDTEVLGTDLSPIQPLWVPENCIFEVDDFESDWLFHKPFDFIHARELGGCISNSRRLFRQALDNLVPGGYLEMQAVHAEFKSDDDTMGKAEHALFWMKTIVEGSVQFGKPLNSSPKWKQEMEEAGFVDVKQKILKIPIGSWPKDPTLKEIGHFQSLQEAKLIASYTPGIFSRILHWKDAEIQVLMAQVKKDLSNPAIHLYVPVYFIWGRKPE